MKPHIIYKYSNNATLDKEIKFKVIHYCDKYYKADLPVLERC